MFVTPAFAAAPAEGQTHTETGVAHDAGHGTGVFPPFDTTTFPSQLLWLVLTFGVFYMLMQKVIVPRVGGILENRHDRIAQDLDEAARLKSEADAAIETYEKELSAARAKAGQIATARATAPRPRLMQNALPSRPSCLKSSPRHPPALPRSRPRRLPMSMKSPVKPFRPSSSS